MSQRLVVLLTMTIHVDSHIDGVTKGLLVGDALAGNVERGFLIGCGHDGRDTSLQLHTVLLCKGLERHDALIVVHGEHTIELLIEVLSEELIGHVGTKHLHTFLHNRVDGRTDNLLLLCSLLGIECQDGDAGVRDAEVALQTLVEDTGLLTDLLGSDGGRHLLQRQMGGYQSDTHDLTHHHRQRLILLRTIVGGLHWSRHQHIVEVLYQVLLRTSHRLTGSLGRLLRRLTELHLHLVVERSQEVQASIAGIFCLVDG